MFLQRLATEAEKVATENNFRTILSEHVSQVMHVSPATASLRLILWKLTLMCSKSWKNFADRFLYLYA